jgi:hypothetical protein
MDRQTMPKQIGVRLPPMELDRLRHVAESEGRTMSGQIRYWVIRALAQQQQDQSRAS